MKNWPVVGTMIEAVELIFLEKANTPEEREAVIK
jgi:hypothetical protein